LRTGLGPGGLNISEEGFPITGQCLSGSSHGGTGKQATFLSAGPKYDEDDITSLLGGSGGETVFVIIFCYPVRIFPLHSFSLDKCLIKSLPQVSLLLQFRNSGVLGTFLVVVL